MNGVMTYDRAVVKLSPAAVAPNKRMYAAPPAVSDVLPASDRTPQIWRYTTKAPGGAWMSPSFDDAAWSSGPGGFGSRDTRFAKVGTEWRTAEIWLRRTFEISSVAFANPHLRVFHDDDATVYLNGQLVAVLAGSNPGYSVEPLPRVARASLRQGRNSIAVHVKQTRGGQFVDVGIVDVR